MRKNERMSKTDFPEIDGLYFCEDFRLDAQGKPIVIGLMPPMILVDFPFSLASGLTCFGTMRFPPTSTIGARIPFIVELQDSEGTVYARATGVYNVEPYPTLVNAIFSKPVTLPKEGEYFVVFRLKEQGTEKRYRLVTLGTKKNLTNEWQDVFNHPEFQPSYKKFLERFKQKHT